MKLKSGEVNLRHVKLSDARMLLEIEQDKETQKNIINYANSIKEVEDSIKEHISEYRKEKPCEEKFIIEYEGKKYYRPEFEECLKVSMKKKIPLLDIYRQIEKLNTQ